MPPLTRWHIRTALVYLVVVLGLGALIALRALLPLPDILSGFGPVYFHLLMVGWVTQLIFGVGYWMFPKFSPAQPRGNERLGWATYWLLNTGLVLRLIGEPLLAGDANWMVNGLVALAAILQWLAGMGFVVNTWQRIKEK
jgi:heme/copper-type cytochrome/quinol oxidase subunit 1